LANISKASVESIITELNGEYFDTRRCFKIENVAGGYQMFTLPEFRSYINKANLVERTQRLTSAGLETLAVVAYKQPVTRAEIERIRGVDCGGVLKTLMSRNLVIIEGRSPAPGNPMLYKTSEYFLEFFGLPSLEHLPPLAEIEDHSTGLPSLRLVKPGESDDDNGNGSRTENFEDDIEPLEDDTIDELIIETEEKTDITLPE
jgi:segregation and condensation protein B